MIPDVCRFSVVQQLGGQPVINIIDMQVDTTGSEVSRADALHEIAGDILNNWDDHVLIEQRADVTALEVAWLDLDSLTGSTGTRSSTSANTWPKAGGYVSGSVMPAVVALRVDKNVDAARGSKKGRMYLAGMSEEATGTGVSQQWDANAVSVMNGAMADFLAGINDQDIAGIPLAVQRQMVVVHAAAGTYSEVSSLTVNPNVSTQVRRGVLR